MSSNEVPKNRPTCKVMNKEEEQGTNPVDAIRQKCRDCCAGGRDEIRECEASTCPLWPFRMGGNPFRKKREMTPEQIEASKTRLAAARAAKKSPDEEGDDAEEGTGGW